MLFIVFVSFILFNYRIASKISNKNFDEFLISGYIVQAGSIILSGYILSYFTLWHSAVAWSILPFFVSYSLFLFFKTVVYLLSSENRSSFKLVGLSIQQIHEVYKQQRKSEKFLFACIFVGILIISASQLFLFFYLPPNEWDSMTGHLNRILYFVQNHSTAHFIGTNWNIDTYPKSFSSIQFYPFLMTGFNEHFFKLPNLSAYWMLFIGSYAILKQLKIDFKARLLSASLLLFTPIVLIQSTTTDTDIVLGAYIVCGLYFLFRYLNSKEVYYIYLAGFTLAIAFSHKITFVFVLPSLGLFLVYLIYKNFAICQFRHLKHFLFSLFFVVIITLPTGYLANLEHYGHPIGPETATKHQSVERAGSASNLFVYGSKNMARYFFDLLNFDGLRNIEEVETLQEKLNSQFRRLDQRFNWELESSKEFTIIPFNYTRKFEFYNGTPIYGSVFILIILPAILLLFIRRQSLIYYVFFTGFVFHFFALSFTAAYDPWKGRYMISSLLFLLPISTLIFNQVVNKNRYKLFIPIFVIIILSAWSTIAFHGRSAFLSSNNSPTIWNKSRMQILTVSRPDITNAYERFDKLVPIDATVALGTINDDYEYPLWGASFKRKLIPINPFEKGLQTIPSDADYLFFSKNVIQPIQGDIRLGTDTTIKERIIVQGEDYYLRKLK
ncbi:MAG: hypothetical protein RLZZ44_1141 [Bacteroidota bacterium]